MTLATVFQRQLARAAQLLLLAQFRMDFSAQMIFVPVSGVVTRIGNELSLLLMGTESGIVTRHSLSHSVSGVAWKKNLSLVSKLT
jgi:hypothetical protein